MIVKRLLSALLLCLFLSGQGQVFAQTTPNSNTNKLITLTAVGAGTFDSADMPNSFGKGAVLGINLTVNSGTVSVTVTLQGKDAASGQYYTVCQSAALASTAFSTLSTYPGQTTTANVACGLPLPPTYRVHVVSATGVTPNLTMTVGAGIIN